MTIDWDEKKALLQEPNIAAVTQLCDELMEKKPGSVVPYIDPIHDEDECRIVSLFASPGPGTGPRFISIENDDETAARTQHRPRGDEKRRPRLARDEVQHVWDDDTIEGCGPLRRERVDRARAKLRARIFA